MELVKPRQIVGIERIDLAPAVAERVEHHARKLGTIRVIGERRVAGDVHFGTVLHRCFLSIQ